MGLAARPVAWGGVLAGAVATLFLAALATRADEMAIGAHAATTVGDVGVGLAFVLAALAATGPARQRLLIAAVGPAWLAGSLFQSALSLHQAVLGLALLATPSGTIRDRGRLTVAVLGTVLVAGEVLPQPAVAGYFLVVAAVVWLGTGSREATTTFAGCAAVVVAVVLAYGWWAVPRGTAASTALTIYEVALTALAVGLSVTTWVDARGHAKLADQVLGGASLTGLEALRQILARALNDEDLRIELVERPLIGDGTRVQVYDGDKVVAAVSTRSATVADAPTAAAVAKAVRLTVANVRLIEAQTRQVTELEASRARLLLAADQERERVAARLRAEAGRHLEQALAELADPRSYGEMSELVCLVEGEIVAALAEVERLVAGAPAVALGNGRLGAALTALAARSPVPVELDLADDATADASVETALFYVCSEALTNVARHSGALEAGIRLSLVPAGLALVVRDNGRGGAIATGSGLQGLRDRMATLGGTLVIGNAPQGGTIITATARTR